MKKYCRNCGRKLKKSTVDGYLAYCKYCDEDFFDIECFDERPAKGILNFADVPEFLPDFYTEKEPKITYCGYCGDEIRTHKKCKHCEILMHEKSAKYECLCGEQHNEISEDEKYCKDCFDNGYYKGRSMFN